jgi:two-component sensor histidine kinase
VENGLRTPVLAVERTHLSAERDSIINRLNFEFDTQQKEASLQASKKELQLNAKNIHIQRTSIIVISTLLVVALLMSYILFQLNRKNKKISQQNENLVREQNHRVINNLQIVSSLLFLQSKQLADPGAKTAIEESRLRIESMSLIHQKLYNSNKAKISLHEFIAELTENVLSSYNCPLTSVILEVESITLPAEQAIPVGMILTELLTNACKYAFHEHPSPELYIHCEFQKDAVHLNVIDNGLGNSYPNDYSTKKSFGMRLIRMQVDQLGGNYQFCKNQFENNLAGHTIFDDL